jgi:hypothetical protein
MYNRILKRPMFKRGGSSYQSQGTGITSPYDTPRKNYDAGAWGEWEDKTRKLTKDPRGDFSYAAEGFSSLGNPYKESGEAKTIGEMLWEGANITRGSREKASELERKGELAILESQGGRMLTEEERAWKEEQAELERASKEKIAKDKGTYPDMHPGKLYDTYIGKWRTWVDKNEGRAGHGVVRDNVESFVDADIVIRGEKINAYKADKKSLAQAVPPSAFKDDGTVDITLLSGAVVYYNPISKEWFTVSNAGTESAEPIVVESYIDGWNNIDQDTSSDSSQKTVDELSETDETIKTKKQAKKFEDVDYSQYTAKDFMPTSGPDVIEESIKTADKTGKDVTDFWKWVASPKGVALQNKNTDQAATELDQLKGWWNDQAWNKDEG